MTKKYLKMSQSYSNNINSNINIKLKFTIISIMFIMLIKDRIEKIIKKENIKETNINIKYDSNFKSEQNYSNYSQYNEKDKLFICLCAFGKNENLYAKEFVNHYLNLGYNHIYIYDNNDIEGEKFESILEEEIKNGYVSIIDFRGYRNAHKEAYWDCYERYNRNYQWLSFFDFDEFLELRQKMTIIQYLNQKKFNKCKSIKINWLVYTDNNLIYFKNESLSKRFNHPNYNHSMNTYIKSTVRGNLNLNYWKYSKNTHSSFYGFPSCSSSGRKILNNLPLINPPDFNGAILKHYFTKTIEEFIKKIERGQSAFLYGKPKSYIKERIELFFSLNKMTIEKLTFIHNKLNIVDIYGNETLFSIMKNNSKND